MDLTAIIFTYMNLGLEHIITGYDHMLFLLALIIITKQFVEVLKIVTAFTIAHSITLFLATMELVPIYPKWIEAGIAITICYIAVENFIVKKSGWRWALTFVFGLIHGVGFASSISSIGFDKTYLITSLLSFNAGIELGQLAVIAIALPLLFKLRSNTAVYNIFFRGTSACIFLIGAYWFVDRVAG